MLSNFLHKSHKDEVYTIGELDAPEDHHFHPLSHLPAVVVGEDTSEDDDSPVTVRVMVPLQAIHRLHVTASRDTSLDISEVHAMYSAEPHGLVEPEDTDLVAFAQVRRSDLHLGLPTRGGYTAQEHLQQIHIGDLSPGGPDVLTAFLKLIADEGEALDFGVVSLTDRDLILHWFSLGCVRRALVSVRDTPDDDWNKEDSLLRLCVHAMEIKLSYLLHPGEVVTMTNLKQLRTRIGSLRDKSRPWVQAVHACLGVQGYSSAQNTFRQAAKTSYHKEDQEYRWQGVLLRDLVDTVLTRDPLGPSVTSLLNEMILSATPMTEEEWDPITGEDSEPDDDGEGDDAPVDSDGS